MKSRTILLVSGITTVLLITIMLLHSAPLKDHPISPNGIVDLELTGTVPEAVAIYNAWFPEHTSLATKNTGIDFLLLLSYGTFLSVACYSISRLHKGFLMRVGLWLARLMIVAAGFDAIENVLMLTTLSAHFKKEIIATTFMFASIKFFLLGVGIIYIVLAGSASLFFPAKKLQQTVDFTNGF